MQLRTFDASKPMENYRAAEQGVRQSRLQDYNMKRQGVADERATTLYEQGQEDRTRGLEVAGRRQRVEDDKQLDEFGRQQVLSINPDAPDFQEQAHRVMDQYTTHMKELGYDDNAIRTQAERIFKSGALTPDGVKFIQEKSGVRRPMEKASDLTSSTAVQSSKILPGGLVEIVRKDGSVSVVSPKEAETEQIRSAETYGAELQGLRSGERAEATSASKMAAKSYKELSSVRKNIINMDEGIRLLDEGAETGVVMSKLPSVKAASIRLDNLQNRLGLDVIGGTTFGALSESELAFALATALPKNLDAPELKKWMIEKRDAQNKLATYLEEATVFLGTPGNTAADWVNMKKEAQATSDAASPQGEVIEFGDL